MEQYPPSPNETYYDVAWETKLSRPEYATLERRWRSRWDFVVKNISEGTNVLDVGCGDGILGEQLIRLRSCSVTGVDVSGFALTKAAGFGIKTQKCDISASPLPFDGDTFDAVVLSCVLEHVARPENALAEACRVLHTGGRAFITIPNPMTLRIRVAFLLGRFHSDFLHSKPGEGLHYRFWPVKDGLETMMDNLGLPLKLAVKHIDVKNPRKYSGTGLRWRRALIAAWPALFGEYTHYIFKKETR